ncbi:ThiF family adenylyltransferase [Candidatus Nomurabacteria bacterium]|nr:ThiF family adenylyltransferase [Candidatus Nomurabacteria bacterium]
MTLYPDRLGYGVVCVGAGGIGSHVLPMLARAGVTRFVLYDDDTVADVNLQMQNFNADEIGQHKVYVMEKRLRAINPAVCISARPVRFGDSAALDGIVVSAVDSMQSRTEIFDAVRQRRNTIALFIDGRLTRSGDFIDLYFIDPKNGYDMQSYESLLFGDPGGPQPPRPDSMTAHVPLVLAGLIGEVLAQWGAGRRHPWKVTYDGLAHHTERYYAQAFSQLEAAS